MGTNQLPVEIIDLIVNHFKAGLKQTAPNPLNTADKPFLKRSAMFELLNLRLINKTWSIAIIPHIYQDMSLSAPSMIECLKDTWNHSKIISITSRVQRLCFDQVEYPNLKFTIHLDGQTLDQMAEPKGEGKEHNREVTLTRKAVIDSKVA
ncbi:uncharacterized protein MELLADRAFT_102589 [Melampsora larici-populina 98AG31]|uniref:Uncharacterized protein n=1 Tax=Melampsora larici-populina (strain 98AG31 / pathotype 3-4-7) TaxID=747676 RepID=F4R799_MELLP|nr:uncharacterized protein MELLADRAFT_102589 [Melampsora larici-populina 98AG31]EGG11554.1 hypothetical protein MELLADRAFT_102589 [Melampsora larici-populina 98AG31]